MSGEQKIRSILFYVSLFIFVIGLPFILSFALSYKFNLRTFKFSKAGLLALRTQPQGASIYLDGKLLNEKTPATINELLPGKYNIRVELEKHYPWIREVGVEPGQVTRLEKIILFPLRQNVKQLNKDKISSFWLDEENEKIYYINQEDNVIYKSDLEGESFKEICICLKINPPPKKWKVSADKEKLLGFNLHQIAIAYLNTQSGLPSTGLPLVLDYSHRKIVDVFWHSDSYHLIIITDRNIEVLEADPQAAAVNLVNLNKKNISAFYDEGKDTLYFLDSGEGSDGKLYDNVYRLELNAKVYPFQDLIKPKPVEPP